MKCFSIFDFLTEYSKNVIPRNVSEPSLVDALIDYAKRNEATIVNFKGSCVVSLNTKDLIKLRRAGLSFYRDDNYPICGYELTEFTRSYSHDLVDDFISKTNKDRHIINHLLENHGHPYRTKYIIFGGRNYSVERPSGRNSYIDRCLTPVVREIYDILYHPDNLYWRHDKTDGSVKLKVIERGGYTRGWNKFQVTLCLYDGDTYRNRSLWYRAKDYYLRMGCKLNERGEIVIKDIHFPWRDMVFPLGMDQFTKSISMLINCFDTGFGGIKTKVEYVEEDGIFYLTYEDYGERIG